jgi:hypothetical protein
MKIPQSPCCSGRMPVKHWRQDEDTVRAAVGVRPSIGQARVTLGQPPRALGRAGGVCTLVKWRSDAGQTLTVLRQRAEKESGPMLDLKSVDCRSNTGQMACWLIAGQMSVIRRSEVGGTLVKCWSTGPHIVFK